MIAVEKEYETTTDQYGTQLDPPARWDERGATISDISVRPLVVMDIHERVAGGGTGGYAQYIAVAPADCPHGVSVHGVPGAPLSI